ncbi:MAG: hypothetical protein E7511_04375 [Ruminococcus sp.]|nr:hypothetical protein [Ruminococcus sp.]
MERIKTFWKELPKWYFILSVLMLYGFTSMLLGIEIYMTPFLIEQPAVMTAIAYLPISLWLGHCFTCEYKGVPKPQSQLGLFAPHLFMLFWTLLLYFLTSDTEELVRSGGLEEVLGFLQLWHILLLSDGLMPALLVHLMGFLCFGLGAHIRARYEGYKRTRPTLRQCAVLCGFAVVFCLAGCGFRQHRSLTTVDVDDADEWIYVDQYIAAESQQGYGFPYENGWSSINLSPYYVHNPDNILAKPTGPAAFTIDDKTAMPVLDGAEAAYPVYAAFANACYEDIAAIHENAAEPSDSPIRFTNTVEAYKSLIAGDVDIFFGAKPSAAQLALAEEAGVELELTPIGKEAFVFFVSQENPVDGLTSEQLRDIYSGKVKNWIAVGGKFVPILAFQRPENSGSQTMMQHFMGDVPLKKPVEVEFEMSMVGVIHSVAEYQNKASSIGYSFRYYASLMTAETQSGIKFLSLDGVYPDAETIRNDRYPMTTSLYAITIKGNPKETVTPFVEWMTGAQGQEIVEKTGYIGISSH